ncbi:hypothetical protein FUAX_44320 (plasmid) [Fulvitalea axinellae]|uniref:Uncharacterized protein n=1 Tax=Fulvitalea axinellae TaxID=1182444 RepID=A0AAU9DHG5_9BACT|nr:hypothetical protein FUAX_44320 [Fulvitalea axinellae]
MKVNIRRYIGEGALIVFSVLFALFINQTFEDYRIRKKKDIAKESILKEIKRNQETLNQWKTTHAGFSKRIKDMHEGRADSLKVALFKGGFLNIGVLTNGKSFANDFLSMTAWESARTTGIITEFDYETIEMLTEVYTVQDLLVNKTLMGLLDSYFDPNTHNLENKDRTMMHFRVRIMELTSQEQFMGRVYKNAIKRLEE